MCRGAVGYSHPAAHFLVIDKDRLLPSPDADPKRGSIVLFCSVGRYQTQAISSSTPAGQRLPDRCRPGLDS
jgi:hypothetical protein